MLCGLSVFNGRVLFVPHVCLVISVVLCSGVGWLEYFQEFYLISLNVQFRYLFLCWFVLVVVFIPYRLVFGVYRMGVYYLPHSVVLEYLGVDGCCGRNWLH